jgi:hypothetical protein
MHIAIGCTENQDKGKNINKYDFFLKACQLLNVVALGIVRCQTYNTALY